MLRFILFASLCLPLVIGGILLALHFFALPRLRRSLRHKSLRKRKLLLKTFKESTIKPVVVGFFHPYCNAGGGGERVLWAAIRSTHIHFPQTFCVVYTGDIGVDKEAIVKRAKEAFGIDLDARKLGIVHLTKRHLVAPETWPHFTLIGQSLGSLPLAFEAISQLVPDVFIDTMGYAFIYPAIFYLLGVPIATYTHYPTISSDMLNQVKAGHVLKLIYWKCFARLYSLVGGYADLVMANSSWTRNHLASLWHCDKRMSVVYPPCNTATLSALPINEPRNKEIVCVAQFRREKNHSLILRAFANFLQQGGKIAEGSRLILIGTVRNEADRVWIDQLQGLANDLKINAHVDFRTDVPWPTIVETLGKAYVGCNAMWNEHFGIGVVEYMAAGLICVVHDSAGPKLDIVTPYEGAQTGFHAKNKEDFTRAFQQAFSMSDEACCQMRKRAQQSAGRFSENVFDEAWQRHMSQLLRLERQRKLA